MQYAIGGGYFVGGTAATIFLGTLQLGLGLTVTFAVPMVLLAVYGLARLPA